jgi:hypothetical protein
MSRSKTISTSFWTKILAIAAAVLVLDACTPTNYAAQQEAQTPMAPAAPTDILTGSRMTLRVPLTLPASGGPLLFQSNAIVPSGSVARNAPFCRFATAGAGVPRTLKPVTFTVRNIDYDDRTSRGGSAPVSVTHYRLVSDPKHAGYVLSCQWPEGAPALAFVTTDEVQATVSAFFALDAVN